MPFTKFPVLLQVQRKNGLQINKIYENDVKCAELVHCISICLKGELVKSMRESEFFSVLIDAATDSGNKENEAVVVRYVKDGVMETSILGVIELEHADSAGTVAAIDKAFSSADEDLILENHMVAFCSDGASVNFGSRSGVAKQLTDRCPWLIPIWCLPHRLELAVTDMLKKSDLGSKVVDALHLIYKTYHYSPKSKRELQLLAKELGVRIKTPTRVKGTRWSPHTEKALQILILPHKGKSSADEGQYSIVFNHMEHLAATSTNADVKGRATHLVRLMKTFNFIAFCHILLDVLKVVSCLSCDLQDNKTILMTATTSIKSTMSDLELLKTAPLENGSTANFIEFMKAQTEKADVKFQGLHITGSPDLNDITFDTIPLSLRQQINEALSMVTDGMKNRFRSILGIGEDDNQAKVVKSFSVFNHDTWPESECELAEYGNEQVLFITHWFEAILLSNGCSLQSVLKEWKSLKVRVNVEFKDKSFTSLWKILLSKEPYSVKYMVMLYFVLNDDHQCHQHRYCPRIKCHQHNKRKMEWSFEKVTNTLPPIPFLIIGHAEMLIQTIVDHTYLVNGLVSLTASSIWTADVVYELYFYSPQAQDDNDADNDGDEDTDKHDSCVVEKVSEPDRPFQTDIGFWHLRDFVIGISPSLLSSACITESASSSKLAARSARLSGSSPHGPRLDSFDSVSDESLFDRLSSSDFVSISIVPLVLVRS
ncbi:hypothetical protein KUTeg_024841 [Tegillarca granosa]|uniref:DUF4371 domain-containing protein n=1 Tax=Tegillarca granosa TaxID=220873 RepID=A0ABQ9DZH8_TEGGR|nr:hypothetical protein KUTeg_024841 [Tegillarca granosa]